MDHYFDKLLQIAVFDPKIVKNKYLCEEATRRVEPLVQICLKWGKTGVVPEKLILSHFENSKSDSNESSKAVAKIKTRTKIPLLKK